MDEPSDHFPLLATVVFRALAAAVCVVAASVVGLWLASTTGSAVSPFWPASGVAVGAVLIWGWPALAGVGAGIMAFNIYAGLPGVFVVWGGLALVAEAALAAAIVRAVIGKRARLNDLRGLLAIVIGAAWLPPLFNALFCARFMPLSDGTPFLADGNDMFRFVMANGFGIALITPAMLVWWRTPVRGWWWRFSLALAGTALAAWLAFGLGQPSFLLLIPALAAAVSTGLRGASVICALAAVVVVILTGMGFGPLATPQGADYSRVYSLFAVLAFGVLPVGAASGEYRRLLRQRRAAEASAGLRFWEWNDTDGLRLEGDGAQAKLFEPAQDRGSLETQFGGRDALSFWQVVTRRPDGSPREAAGMLIDVSDRMQLEKTRRRTWESEVELRNLRASLTPHLLFNCLAAVRGIVRTDPEKAREFIDTLSRFLRESTDAQSRETVPLHEEWQLCENFLGLQAFRYERELPRLVEIQGPAHHAKLPPMMLLNLVENAVKHGEVSQKHPLVVRAKLQDGKLIAEVRNRGQLGPVPQGRSGGIGTANARLQAIYGSDASLAIRQDGEEVSATLELPDSAPGREAGVN
jgi:integral membrane sensor domain MASE1